MADVPHLRIPLQLADGRFAQVEQDSPEDVEQCVKVILRTPYGVRDDLLDLGLTMQEFRQGGPDLEEIHRQIETYEPRVDLDRDDVDVQFTGDGAIANVTVRLIAR